MQTPMQMLAGFVILAIRVYMALIFVWVLGSWFPQWRGKPWYRVIEDLINPYMNLFKALPLRMGMIDLTPMAAIFVLIIVENVLHAVARGGM